MIWGEGNPNAKIFVILDYPGARENKAEESYVCGTRQTLQETANDVGLTEHDLYVTYILKRRPIRTYDKPKTRQICIEHLWQQLRVKKPNLIFCLGNIAVQNFFKDDELEVKQLRDKIHHVNGYDTVVSYHPLAVRRRPNLMSFFLKDWQLIMEYYLSKGP